MRTPEDTVRAMLAAAGKLWNGDPGQVDELAGFYAEETDVRHPMAPLGGDAPLLSREALRIHFTAAGEAAAGTTGVGVEGLRIHHSADPEVVVAEFAYRGDPDWRAAGIIVFRIRDGLIIESRDYFDHIELARATGALGALCAALTASA